MSGWVRWFPGDWRGSALVAGLSLAERGLYRELLDMQAALGGPFDLEPDRLARQLRCDQQEFNACWTVVQRAFEQTPDGRWFNAKMQVEIDRSAEISEQARKAGRASAEARSRQRALQRTLERSEPTPVGTDAPTPVPTTPTPTPTQRQTQTQREKSPARKRARAGKDPDLEHRRGDMEFWRVRWRESRSCDYVPVAKDWAALKKAVGLAGGDHQEVRRRMVNLLDSEDAWVSENASLSLLHSRWNNLAVVPGSARNGKPKTIADFRKEHGV